MENIKECPYCAEIVNIKALVCRHCLSTLGGGAVERAGQNVKVRIKAQNKLYFGEVFVPGHLERVSDVLNDQRPFILLTNAWEAAKNEEIQIGFLAINKKIVHWVRLQGE